MSLPDYAITDESELKAAVRDTTSYDNNAEGLPASQLDGIVSDAMRDMHIETGTDQWYSDMAYGQALKAHTCILAKAAVENINIVSYSIGDENVRLANADPEDSQQIQNWAKQVAKSLQKSDLEFDDSGEPSFSNTSGYVG